MDKAQMWLLSNIPSELTQDSAGESFLPIETTLLPGYDGFPRPWIETAMKTESNANRVSKPLDWFNAEALNWIHGTQ